MHIVLCVIAIFLAGMMAVASTVPADARKARAQTQLSAEAREREEKRKLLEEFEAHAREFALYQECAVKTKAIENDYLESPAAKTADVSSTDEYLFRIYLKTVKWDNDGCFEWKDVAAAKRMGKSLKDYVIGGVHPTLRDNLRKLFVALESEECSPGTKCRPGITSAFRDNYRQKIATGFKASECQSMHGGSCRTKGWGDGRAIDVVNVSDPDVFDVSATHPSEVLWKHIDKLGPPLNIYRPMKNNDPMHIQTTGFIRSLIESGKQTIQEIGKDLEKTKESTEKVIEKFKKKK